MSKRVSFAEGLSKVREVSGRAPAEPEVVATVDAGIAPAAKSGTGEGSVIAPSRKGKVAISAYFDPAVRQQLAMLHIKQNRSQAALMAEALNLLFERYGESPIAKA